MDFLQLVFAFVNAPLFATFLLGMFWRRTTGHAAFWGLIGGTLAAAIHHGVSIPAGAVSHIKGGWMGFIVHTYPNEMAQKLLDSHLGFQLLPGADHHHFVAYQTNKSDEELKGLVYSLTPRLTEKEYVWYKKPTYFALFVGIVALVLSIIYW
jgi:SSS family solute:Na+ symporter